MEQEENNIKFKIITHDTDDIINGKKIQNAKLETEFNIRALFALSYNPIIKHFVLDNSEYLSSLTDDDKKYISDYMENFEGFEILIKDGSNKGVSEDRRVIPHRINNIRRKILTIADYSDMFKYFKTYPITQSMFSTIILILKKCCRDQYMFSFMNLMFSEEQTEEFLKTFADNENTFINMNFLDCVMDIKKIEQFLIKHGEKFKGNYSNCDGEKHCFTLAGQFRTNKSKVEKNKTINVTPQSYIEEIYD